jgi:hypothetical protein
MTKHASDKIAAGLNQAIGYAQGQREASQWQPIESAPKDGTAVLAYCPDAQPTVGVVAFQRGWQEWSSVPGVHTRKPTHWMHLPEPPNA